MCSEMMSSKIQGVENISDRNFLSERVEIIIMSNFVDGIGWQ